MIIHFVQDQPELLLQDEEQQLVENETIIPENNEKKNNETIIPENIEKAQVDTKRQ